MILERIELTNFRCFEHLSIELERDLTVFVGTNGSGKTAVLDAIALALAPLLGRFPWPRKIKKPQFGVSDIRRLEEGQLAPFASIAATGREEDSVIRWDRLRHRDSSSSTQAQSPGERRELAELYHFADRLIDAHNEERPYTLPVFAFYGTQRALSRRKERPPLQRRLPFFRRLDGLKDALQARTDFQEAVAWFEFLEQWVLRDERDDYDSEALPSLEAVRSAIRSMLPQISNPRIDGGTGRLLIDIQSADGLWSGWPVDGLSDGYKVILGLVMDFALRLALANPPAPKSLGTEVLASEAILLIDELDLHLHPSWQQRVISDLRRTFPNTQLIVTTHSPQVLTTVKAESIRMLEQAPDGSWTARTPLEQTRGVESAQVLAAVMKVDPVPSLPETEMLSDYRALIETGQGESEAAKAMRAKLDAHFGARHQVLLDCDRLLRFQAFKNRVQSKAEGAKD